MKRKFASIALLVLGSMAALAQTGSPAVPAATPAAPAAVLPNGNKVAVIAMQDAIAGSNEGQRDLEALAKKFEPRRAELQKLNNDIEELKKQLSTQGDKMNADAHENLVKSIETKQKSLQRSAEDAQNELQKVAPVVMKYLADKGYGLLGENSSPWPQGPVVFGGPSFDITKGVVDAYNAQSGVPAPARSGAAPGAAKPATTTPAKPAATTPKPAPTTPKQ